MIFFHFTRRKKKSGWNHCETLFCQNPKCLKLFWSYLKLHFCVVPRVISWRVWSGRMGRRLGQYNLNYPKWIEWKFEVQLIARGSSTGIQDKKQRREKKEESLTMMVVCQFRDWIYTALVWISIMFGYLWKMLGDYTSGFLRASLPLQLFLEFFF